MTPQDPRTIIGDDGDEEWLCKHGVGHSPKVHSCDGCCCTPEGYKAMYRALRLGERQ
jgi:hypothetical protein